MTHFEYKVIPAPTKGKKAPGVKSAEARFAHGLQEAMNDLAADGWEYVRSDLLPSEERQGLTSSQTIYRSVLVFRRAIPATIDQPIPPVAAAAKEPAQPTVSNTENVNGPAEGGPEPDADPHWTDEGTAAPDETPQEPRTN